MVQIADAVLVSPVAGLAVEAGLTRPPPARILHDHRLAEVLVELEVVISPLHELGRLREILLLPLQWLFAWKRAEPKRLRFG